MITTSEYADMSARCKSVKLGETVKGGFECRLFGYSHGWSDGFYGCTYARGDEIVVAFKGTGRTEDLGAHYGHEIDSDSSTLQDLAADLKLAVGILPNQSSSAHLLYKRTVEAYGQKQFSVVGHSLGGYLAQVVSYWYKCPCVTFNAPGAWGDLQRSKLNVFAPQRMVRSVQASFGDNAPCTNFIHLGDPIGNYGLHRGVTHRLMGVRHAMAVIQDTIEQSKWKDINPFPKT